MERLQKFCIAVTTTTSVALCVVVGLQSGRISRLEMDVHPERYAIAQKEECARAVAQKAEYSKSVENDRVAEAKVVARANMGVTVKDEGAQEEIIGEARFHALSKASEKGFYDPSFHGLSRVEETEMVDHLQSLGAAKFHNYRVSYASDGSVLVEGTARVAEIRSVSYEIRPDPSRNGVWGVYRLQRGPGLVQNCLSN